MADSAASTTLRLARLVRLGVTGELRNPGLRVLGAAAALGAAVFTWNQGNIPAATALLLGSVLGRGFGIAAALWFGYAGVRDLNEKTGAALRSKPLDGAAWVFVSWLTGLLVWLVLLALTFAGAAVGQLPAAGLASLACHGLAFGQAAVLLAAVATLSFALSRMMRSPLGGILVVFAWFCAMAGVQYIPTYLRPDYSQNRIVFVMAALLLLTLAALGVERFRRGELRQPLAALVAVCVLAFGTVHSARWVAGRTPDYLDEEAVVWGGIARQHLEDGKRMPGFWLPDGRGGLIRSAAYTGKVLLVFLFAGDDLDAAGTLPALEAIRREYGDRGVQPIAICLSPDHGAGTLYARTGGYSYPIGLDLSTRTTSPPDSAVASAFYAQYLPMLVVTDRRRQVRSVQLDPRYDMEQLRRLVLERLEAEPE